MIPDATPKLREDLLGPYVTEFFDRLDLNSSLTELSISQLRGFVRPLRDFQSALGSIRVFQLSPSGSREFGVPTPGAELTKTGGNLPAVVDLMQRRFKPEWNRVLIGMRQVLPGLLAIEVGYARTRTLELLFQEHGFGRPWTIGEVSDGTVQTLALLVAIHDPRATALVLEEPEYSVHPWIIRHIVRACIEASTDKQVFITTHSPVVINHVQPAHVWVIWRRNGESRVARLIDRDSGIVKMWGDGDISTFDYLDSGAVEEAIPPGPELAVQLEIEGMDKDDMKGGRE